MTEPEKILIGVTGASGMIFALEFLQLLSSLPVTVHGIVSSSGRQVLQMEQGVDIADLQGVEAWFDEKDFSAPPASGSAGYDAMVILPCTMGTLAAIAGGMSANLIHRSADVILKERKRLVLGVRETPFNRTHLNNMLTVHDAGGVICPPMPSYYLKPESIEDAARTYCWRVADLVGLEVPDRKRWGDPGVC